MDYALSAVALPTGRLHPTDRTTPGALFRRRPQSCCLDDRPVGTGGAAVPPPDPGSRSGHGRPPVLALGRILTADGRQQALGGGALKHPDRDPERREFVAAAQDPYGVILSCIDSRVPPELLSDTGLGDLFVMRTGGQVVDSVVIGSVEYGPLTSGTPLIVVLGHQRCGAVKASYEAMRDGKKLPGNLQSIADALRPASKETVKEKHDDPVDAMTRIHVKQTSAALRSNRDLGPLVKKGSLAVVSAYYSLDSGRVEVLTGAPSA